MAWIGLWRWPLILAPLLFLTSCTQETSPDVSSLEATSIDLRITEPPWEPQAQMSRRMEHLTTYLKSSTGLTVKYIPAINYDHSYSLMERGQADLILVGVYGGYRLLKALPDARPLVVQKPSYRVVMLGRRRWMENLDSGEEPSLASVKGRRVGFGSRFSGSTFLQPMLALQEEGLDPSVMAYCSHEPLQRHLPIQVANGQLDFVFVPSFNDQQDHFVPESLRDQLAVVWIGTPRRNDYVVALNRPEDLQRQEHLRLVQQAFLNLDRSSLDGRVVLNARGFPGYELPTPEFPQMTNQRLESLLAMYGGRPICEDS